MLEDTPEAMSKQIIDTAESKALNNILINECKRKNTHIINHSSKNPQRHLNRIQFLR